MLLSRTTGPESQSWRGSQPTAPTDPRPRNAAAPAPAQRLVGLDAFRGLTIAAMVFVRSPGDVEHIQPAFRHAAWHGWTPTDLVFPFFLFIVGAAMPFSLARRRDQDKDGWWPVALHIVKRSVLLAALGVLLNVDWSHPSLRWPSVLTRIGVCFLAAAPLALRARSRTIAAVVGALLLGYWALLIGVRAPTFAVVDGAGDVTEVPRAAGRVDALSKEGSLPSFVDRMVFDNRSHPEYDPEGLLSTFPAIASTLIGVLAGRRLRRASPATIEPEARRLVTWGAGLVVTGLLWGQVLPINKSLWTSSFAVLTAGFALLGVGLLVWACDARGWRRVFRTLEIYGSNALLIYVLSSWLRQVSRAEAIVDPSLRARIYEGLQDWGMAAPAASVAHATLHMLLWLGVAALLYRRRWFVRL